MGDLRAPRMQSALRSRSSPPTCCRIRASELISKHSMAMEFDSCTKVGVILSRAELAQQNTRHRTFFYGRGDDSEPCLLEQGFVPRKRDARACERPSQPVSPSEKWSNELPEFKKYER